MSSKRREVSTLERRVRARLVLMDRTLADVAAGAGLTEVAVRKAIREKMTARVESALLNGLAVEKAWLYSGSLEDVGDGLNVITAAA